MKAQRFLMLAGLALALLGPGSAQAQSTKPAWYVGLGGMPVFQENADSNVDNITNIIKYKTGWGVVGSGGYIWGNGFRTEAELAYRRAKVDTVEGTNAGPSNGGHMSNVSMMGNVLYDIYTGTMVTPYLGAGIGLGIPMADDMRTINGRTLDSTRPTFAYQFIGGMAAAMTHNWALTADYRYFRTLDEKYKTNLGDRATTDNSSHNVVLGIRYTFAPPEARPLPPVAQPAPVPAPAAPPVVRPAVPEVPQSYMVFFDFDKSILTPEAKRIIATAAEDYKSGKYVRIVVTGHTDTMGTPQYNQKLSERRAASVKKEFNRLGVPSGEIHMVGAGESSLLVPTNDQVREAQNRRAEIVFSRE